MLMKINFFLYKLIINIINFFLYKLIINIINLFLYKLIINIINLLFYIYFIYLQIDNYIYFLYLQIDLNLKIIMSITLTYKKAKNLNSNDGLIISDHSCYILLSANNNNRFYIGYTTDFKRRLRQHNGEIVGGAKKTKKWRPWIPLCQITGFFDKSCALRFEYRLQHQKKKKKSENLISYILNILTALLYNKDGSKINNSCIDWPILTIQWYTNSYHIYHAKIINIYNNIIK